MAERQQVRPESIDRRRHTVDAREVDVGYHQDLHSLKLASGDEVFISVLLKFRDD